MTSSICIPSRRRTSACSYEGGVVPCAKMAARASHRRAAPEVDWSSRCGHSTTAYWCGKWRVVRRDEPFSFLLPDEVGTFTRRPVGKRSPRGLIGGRPPRRRQQGAQVGGRRMESPMSSTSPRWPGQQGRWPALGPAATRAPCTAYPVLTVDEGESTTVRPAHPSARWPAMWPRGRMPRRPSRSAASVATSRQLVLPPGAPPPLVGVTAPAERAIVFLEADA
jgi:hypothetical protein